MKASWCYLLSIFPAPETLPSVSQLLPLTLLKVQTGPTPPQEGPGHVTAAVDVASDAVAAVARCDRTRLADDWVDAAGQLVTLRG